MIRSDTPARPSPDRSERTARPQPGETLLAAQSQTRRGLRAGPHTLAQARSAYSGAQWSGEHDRRPETGLLVRTRL